MKKIKGKICFCVFIITVAFAILTLNIVAADENIEDKVYSDFFEIIESLPETVTRFLPNDIYSAESNAGEEILHMTNASFLWGVIQEILGVELRSAIKLLASLMALMIIAGVFGVVKSSFGDSSIHTAFRFCTVAVIMIIVIGSQYANFVRVKEYFDHLNNMMYGMIPITGAVWAMGGNVSTATAGTVTMYSFLNLSQILFSKTVIPMASIGTCMAFCNGICPDIGIKKISSVMRKAYIFVIGAIMTLFTAILTTQTSITAASDSTAARTAKFVSSTIIPIVGGSVGDSLRTVAAGIQYLKSVLGVGAILLIFLMVLPVLMSLIINRFVLSLSEGISEFLGCDELGSILGELAEVYSVVIAAVSMTSVMFILAFYIFIKTTVAIM